MAVGRQPPAVGAAPSTKMKPLIPFFFPVASHQPVLELHLLNHNSCTSHIDRGDVQVLRPSAGQFSHVSLVLLTVSSFSKGIQDGRQSSSVCKNL